MYSVYSYNVTIILYKCDIVQKKGAVGTTNESATPRVLELVHAYINHLRSQLSPTL